MLVVPIAALFAALFAVYRLEADLQLADQVVVRTYELRAGLVELHGSLVDAQAAIAHHAATRQDRFLATFDVAHRKVAEAQS